MRILRFMLALALLLPCGKTAAQKAALSTNLLGYADLATLNLEGSLGVSQHWSLNAAWRYNPFRFHRNGAPANNRQQAWFAGARYWPWHIYSGWWIAAKAGYQEYNRGGWRSPETQEGDRFGGGVSGGYTYMLHPHLNLEFGLGLWGGYDIYTVYSCPECGLETGSGRRAFLLPNEILLALSYVF